MQSAPEIAAYTGRIVKSAKTGNDGDLDPNRQNSADSSTWSDTETEDRATKAQAEAEAKKNTIVKDAETEAARRLMAVDRDLQDELRSVESSIVDLVLESVRSIVGDMEWVMVARALVCSGLRELQAERGVTIRVSPSDVGAYRKAVCDLNGRDRAAIQEIRIDKDLPEGSCVLEMGAVSLDVGLENQLIALRNLLKSNTAQAA